MKKVLLSIVILGALAGCSSQENFEEISAWMKKEESSMKGKIEPLPEVKSYVNVPFKTNNENPFAMRLSVSMQDVMKNRFAPNMERTKEPLEEYSIDALKMVGSVIDAGKLHGLIKDREGIIHYVTTGNHMGLNFGEVVSLNESEIVLDERVREGDEWRSVKTVIALSQSNIGKAGKSGKK